MKKLLLVHWNEAETQERCARLAKHGYEVEALWDKRSGASLRDYRSDPPDAILIDLTRLPSHGRAVGVFFREQKATRLVPLIFVDGDPEKVAKIREHLPDAVYTTWPKLSAAIKKALAKPVANPVVPRTMDAYSGTPLPKKLGVKPGITVLLLGSPDGFEKQIAPADGPPPVIKKTARGLAELVMLFVKSQADLASRLPAAQKAMAAGGTIWIAWPKKASAIKTDVSEREVRATGLASGLVDFKICAIDNTWSGLRFARKKK